MKRLTCILLSFALFGCATAPLTLNPETTEKMQKIAVVATPVDDEFKVLNHLLTMYGPYSAPSPLAQIYYHLPLSRRPSDNGAPGLLYQYVLKKDSLGGNPKVLKEEIKSFPIKKHIDDFLAEQMSKRYYILESSNFENMKQESKGKDINVDEYFSYCKEIGADTLLTVDFLYGLAAYTEEKASAAIDSLITVYDIKTKKKLLEDVIFSDLYFKEGFSVDDYAANDAKIFKENIIKAARGLSLLIGYKFGIDVEYVDKTKRVLPISGVHVSCKKPYQLEQDCSSLKHAKRKIVINNYGCNIAASRDGIVILIETPAKISEATEEEIMAQDSYLTEKANKRCLELINSELSKNNINIIKKVEIIFYQGSHPEIFGYFLELDDDGYSILKQFTK